MQPISITQFDQVLEYFRQMDPVMLDLVLDEQLRYQGMPCRTFIRKLGAAFRKFRELGNTQLLAFPGHCSERTCGKCLPLRVGYCFVGDSSPHYLAINFQVCDGEVLNIYECSGMAHRQAIPGRQNRIYIDNEL